VTPGFFRGCAELGYEGRVFDLTQTNVPPRALSRQLWSQGVDAIVWFPAVGNRNDWWREFDWNRLAVVQMGRGFLKRVFHQVRKSESEQMLLPLQKIFEKGYRRLLVVLCPSASSVHDRL